MKFLTLFLWNPSAFFVGGYVFSFFCWKSPCWLFLKKIKQTRYVTLCSRRWNLNGSGEKTGERVSTKVGKFLQKSLSWLGMLLVRAQRNKMKVFTALWAKVSPYFLFKFNYLNLHLICILHFLNVLTSVLVNMRA